jgi:hypothetical protein
MTPLFILSSAINSKFGAFSPAQRLQQTLDSVASVRQYCPGADVCLVEMTGVPIPEEQVQIINEHVDYFFDCTREPAVIDIYNSTDNWDIVKNTTEVMCFTNTLTTMIETGVLKDYDRVFKMSGRYLLTENFDPTFYETVADRIVVLERKHSQFPPEVTGGKQFQYMSRLWSWPSTATEQVVDAYNEGFVAMAIRYAEGGYFDIEHMLFAYLPKDLVTEIPRVGLRGLLGPNGVAIED